MATADSRIVQQDIPAELSNEFLSSARVFAWSVREVIERTVLREVAGNSLTFSQLKLLYLVAHTDTLNISDAAAFLGVSAAAASKAVDKLVRRRLLRRAETQAGPAHQPSFLDRNQPQADGSVQRRPRSDGAGDVLAVLRRGVAANFRSSGPSGGRHHQQWRLTRTRCACSAKFTFASCAAFSEYGQRNCFYQHHQTEEQDRASTRTDVLSK